ncbi:MAG: Hsp20/alpha crystallin family protein [Nanoarchaeota archaeon]
MDEDDFFSNNDQFEDIVASFFNRSGTRKKGRSQRQEEDESELGFIEAPDKVFIILEIPGYTQKEIALAVKSNELYIKAKKSTLSNIKEYLAPKFEQELNIIRTIPNSANTKKMNYTYKNGILEVAFEKK